MDFLKLGIYEVEEAKGLVNYKLKLLKGIKIYSVFYVSLLKLVDLDVPLDHKIELNDERSEREYDIETVLDYTIIGRQHKYLIK